MLFIITHNIVHIHYPTFTTQVIIACIIYLILFFIISDIFPKNAKYYLIVIIILDFIYFKNKYDNSPKEIIEIKEDIPQINIPKEIKKYEPKYDIESISLSDMSDVRVSHDTSTEENTLSLLSETSTELHFD